MNGHTAADIAKHITRGQELLRTVRHATMATVNEDGSPHNSPFRFLYAPDLSRIYWGSHPNSIHSRNVSRTGQIFVVLYEANERGGLYIKASGAHALAGDELKAALKVHNAARAQNSESQIGLEYYQTGSPQRMWSASPTNFWVNGTVRDSNGLFIEDIRTEITAAKLLA